VKKRVLIEVTQDDIDQGYTRYCRTNCPAAHAIGRKVKPEFNVHVGKSAVNIGICKGQLAPKVASSPRSLVRFVNRFDLHREYQQGDVDNPPTVNKPEPFKFFLTLAEAYLA